MNVSHEIVYVVVNRELPDSDVAVFAFRVDAERFVDRRKSRLNCEILERKVRHR